MVPDGWRRCTLGEVLRPVSRPEEVSDNSSYSLMGVRLYGDGCRLHSTTLGSELRTRRLNRVAAGDVTYNKMWVSKGAFAVVGAQHDGLFATSEYPTFEPSAELDAGFFGYVMLSDEFQAAAQSRLKGSTSRARLNPKDFVLLQAVLPPLTEQKKIAAILKSVDDAIDKTQAVIGQTEKVKKGLLQELLTRGMPGRHRRFKKTEIGEIPESWALATGDELSRTISVGIVVRPAQYYEDSGIRCFRSANVRENRINDRGWVHISPESHRILSKSRLRAGDVLVVRTGAGTGTSCVVTPEFDDTNCIDIIFARPKPNDIDSHYLAAFINSDLGRRQVLRGQAGLGQKHFNVGALKKMLVGVPPLCEQRQIASRLGDFDRCRAASADERAGLLHLKRGLMNDLLTGRVRVKS